MRRRRCIALLAPAAISMALPVRAQQPMPTVGYLSGRSPSESRHLIGAFLKGLGETGFVEGRNVSIAYRWADGRYDQLPALAAELVGLPVSAIFAAGGTPPARAARAATAMIPIVFSGVNDPVAMGLVANLARPGGNATGMGTLTRGLGEKSIELMRELVPDAGVIAVLLNPSNQGISLATEGVLTAGRALGVTVRILHAATENDFETAYAGLARLKAGAIVVYPDGFIDSQRDRIVKLSARYAVPAIYAWREYAVSGGLITYGSNLADSYRQAATYVGRVLKGEKPADLPVQEPTKFELVINLKTAKALGLTIPPAILTRADEVIE